MHGCHVRPNPYDPTSKHRIIPPKSRITTRYYRHRFPSRKAKPMSTKITRRTFGTTIVGSTVAGVAAAQAPAQDEQRDYPAPTFKPTLRKPRLGSTLAQDFVIFAHYDLDMTK